MPEQHPEALSGDPLSSKPQSVITLGNFDGMHLGHRKLLAKVQELAACSGLQSVVLSYTDHPAFTLKSHPKPQVLMTAAAKTKELKALGIDHVELLTFTMELAHTSADKFLQEYLIPVWQPAIFVMGYDSHFGFQRQGNVDFLTKHAPDFGYRVQYVEPQLYQNQIISSSMIRKLLADGNISLANKLLGKPYTLPGTVGHGISKGHSLGFPTANLIPDNPHQLVPKSGIYFSKALFAGRSFFGLTNIGCSPTVKHSGLVEIETHLLDFDVDIYEMQLELELHQYLREERLFKSEQELSEAIRQDVILARKLIGSKPDAKA